MSFQVYHSKKERYIVFFTDLYPCIVCSYQVYNWQKQHEDTVMFFFGKPKQARMEEVLECLHPIEWRSKWEILERIARHREAVEKAGGPTYRTPNDKQLGRDLIRLLLEKAIVTEQRKPKERISEGIDGRLILHLEEEAHYRTTGKGLRKKRKRQEKRSIAFRPGIITPHGA